MAITLALPRLYDAVGARLIAEGTLNTEDPPVLVPLAAQYFGWREPARQHIGDRIVWVPGEPDGKIGEFGPPKYPGARPDGRHLFNLPEAFHCYLTAYDASQPENELLQYTAARLLLDNFMRLLYVCAHGTLGTLRAAWYSGGKKEFRGGATILLTGSVQAVQPDVQRATAPADTGAILQIDVLDLTEELRVPEGHVPS